MDHCKSQIVDPRGDQEKRKISTPFSTPGRTERTSFAVWPGQTKQSKPIISVISGMRPSLSRRVAYPRVQKRGGRAKRVERGGTLEIRTIIPPISVPRLARAPTKSFSDSQRYLSTLHSFRVLLWPLQPPSTPWKSWVQPPEAGGFLQNAPRVPRLKIQPVGYSILFLPILRARIGRCPSQGRATGGCHGRLIFRILSRFHCRARGTQIASAGRKADDMKGDTRRSERRNFVHVEANGCKCWNPDEKFGDRLYWERTMRFGGGADCRGGW